MILTVTINPLLERRLTYKDISLGAHNRNGIEIFQAGGKGINVSRQLNCLGIDNLALTFLGGTNGKLLRDQLAAEEIKISPVKTFSETRWASVIIEEDKKRSTVYFAQNSEITSSEAEDFRTKLEKMIRNCEIVIFSGSSPCKEADSIFPFGIELAHQHDKLSICDTYGRHLSDCIEASPNFLHNNIDETESSLNISLKSEDEKINYLSSLYEKGIKQVFLTDGEKNTYASNFDFHYSVENPKIAAVDPTGSGDAFTAGIIYGIHNNFTFEDTLKYASALGASNAESFEVCNVPLEKIDSGKSKFRIEIIGKKIKSIDATPR